MFKLPLVKRQEISLEDVSLISYDKVNQSNDYKSIVHFFLDDYKFESIYNNPEKKIEALRQFKAVLTPDFSMFVEMPIALQLFATFKNRWVGAYLQEQGIKVIPTVRWGDLTSFNFCFDGIEKGSIVAVSTIGVKKQKSHFVLGYNEMLGRIKPSKIICYGKDNIPEFKSKEILKMYVKNDHILEYPKYRDVNDFKESLIHGREIQIKWDGIEYSIEYEDDSMNDFSICEANRPETEAHFKSVDELLNSKLNSNIFLKDIITKAEITWRNI